MAVTINASTSAGLVTSADTSGDLNIQSGGSTKIAVTSAGVSLSTPLAAGSGGTGLSSVGTSGNVLTSNGTAWVSSAAGGIGVGQTWQNVLGSRVFGTTYYNTTGKPICVSVGSYGNAGAWTSASVSGSTIQYSSQSGGSGYQVSPMVFIVPDTASYSVSSAGGPTTLSVWWELR
jgi:hypothetical protein